VLRFLVKRLLISVPVLFAVATLTFFLIREAPGDPFADKGRIDEHSQSKPTNPHREAGSKTGQWLNPLTYDYAYKFQAGGVPEPFTSWTKITGSPTTVQWAMRSAGPDLWPTYLSESGVPYDPTNGTVSDGDIFWTGPGKGDDVPLDMS